MGDNTVPSDSAEVALAPGSVNMELPQRKPRPGLHRFLVLARHLPPGSPQAEWVDLGGGAAEFSVLAAELGYQVTLVDGDPRNIANVSALGIKGVLADLNAPLEALRDCSFDGASLVEVVEHVTAAEKLVSESFRVLRPGGLLLLSTPNALWWRARMRVLLGRMPEAEGYHYRFFNIAGTRRLLETAGFRITDMEFSSPAFGYNWIARRLTGKTKRKHVRIPALFARLLAQTVYVASRRP